MTASSPGIPCPATSASGSGGALLARAVYEDDAAGWIPPDMVERIQREAIARCDALDGVADGLVSNPDACRRGSAAALEALRRRAGETGHPAHCLTAAQAERMMRIYHQGDNLPFAFANGARDYLGHNRLEGIAMQLGSQPTLLSPPRSGPNAHHVDRGYQFFRYFEIPGLAHGSGRFAPQSESLAALDAWVEHGAPPDGAVITDGTQSETRRHTRPRCRFPTWPKLTGSGDAREAANFACVAE